MISPKITGKVVGGQETLRKVQSLSNSIRVELRATVDKLGTDLLERAKRIAVQKLNKAPKGNLVGAINKNTVETGNSIVSTVGVSLGTIPYARIHEFGGPDVMRLENVADPKPGPGEVLVRIRAAGINPVDVYMRSGTYPRQPPLPYIPGSDGAGDVESAGGTRGLRIESQTDITLSGAGNQFGQLMDVVGTGTATIVHLLGLDGTLLGASGVEALDMTITVPALGQSVPAHTRARFTLTRLP